MKGMAKNEGKSSEEQVMNQENQENLQTKESKAKATTEDIDLDTNDSSGSIDS
jgi:hypothetical protein